MTNDASQQQLVQFVSTLVATPSVLGNEGAVAALVLQQMKELGFDRVEVDSAGNVIGAVEASRSGSTLLLDAHMDTVDVVPRHRWSGDPFSGRVCQGRIEGRGSSDMKGALGAMVFAAAELARDSCRGRVVVTASVGEESVEGAALAQVLERYPADFVVIGESSELNLIRAGRGRAELILKTLGEPAHASSPHLGVNAIHKMMAVVEAIEALPLTRDPFLGPAVFCFTDLISDPYPAHSVVPSGCRATLERRLVLGETQQDIRQQVERCCRAAQAEDTRIALARVEYQSYTGWKWEQEKWFPPWEIPEDHFLVRRALDGLTGTGLSPRLGAYQFCTNAAFCAGERQIPTIGFGPSSEARAHRIDEYLELDQLVGAYRGYQAIINSVLRA